MGHVRLLKDHGQGLRVVASIREFRIDEQSDAVYVAGLEGNAYFEKLCARTLSEHGKMDFSQIQLIYRAEGNSNLVVAVPEHKKVLRLPKTNPESSKSTADEFIVDTEDHVAYMKLMTRLLGEECSYEPKIVCISPSERVKLNRFCLPHRPAKRLDKEFCGQFGILLPDATMLPDNLVSTMKETSRDTYSVEIKPKQGWMLQDAQLPDLFDLRDLRRCRYCCKQYSKLKSHKIPKLSSYCPMDLFSGEIERMRKALDSLVNEPQNNLRIYRNGMLIYGDHLDSLESLKKTVFEGNVNLLRDFIIHVLLKSYPNEIFSNLKYNVEKRKLPPQCILQRVLDLQLLSEINLQYMAMQSYETKTTYKYLKDMLHKKVKLLQEFTEYEQYMIGATAMDCSMMITFQCVNKEDISLFNESVYLDQFQNMTFLTKVTILDLDPKPDNHFLKYLNKTNEAYKDASEYLKE